MGASVGGTCDRLHSLALVIRRRGASRALVLSSDFFRAPSGSRSPRSTGTTCSLPVERRCSVRGRFTSRGGRETFSGRCFATTTDRSKLMAEP
jgi:hypothetical protein